MSREEDRDLFRRRLYTQSIENSEDLSDLVSLNQSKEIRRSGQNSPGPTQVLPSIILAAVLD